MKKRASPLTPCPHCHACTVSNVRLSHRPWSQALTPEFTLAMSGNTVLEGSEPAAHCYAGYQFQMFSGQLGDGAAMYLGEVGESS